RRRHEIRLPPLSLGIEDRTALVLRLWYEGSHNLDTPSQPDKVSFSTDLFNFFFFIFVFFVSFCLFPDNANHRRRLSLTAGWPSRTANMSRISRTMTSIGARTGPARAAAPTARDPRAVVPTASRARAARAPAPRPHGRTLRDRGRMW